MQPLYVSISISTLLLLALLPWPGSGEINVRGPAEPIIASAGEEAELSCHLSPETDAEDMNVTWYHVDTSALVHHYAAREDHLEDQSQEYRGRTAFLTEDIHTGQVTLRIFPIVFSDDGQYSCVFANPKFRNEAQVELLVTVSGTTPRIHIEPGDTGELKLTCTSTDWYPEPEVQWRDPQGWPLASASETKTLTEKGLFQMETSATVDTKSRDVSCVIRNPVLSKEKVAHISVSDAVFPRLWPWIVGFAVPLCLLAVGATFSVLFVLARRELAERKALGETGLNIIRRFAEDIRLDKNTAHPHLKVSGDGKLVRIAHEWQDVPNNPERFDTLTAVLGENCFYDGDHYWEVDVVWKDRWEIGLCLDSVIRKGDILVRPENGFYALSLKNNQYKALSTPPSILNVPEFLGVVGIFLQYEKGLISFYNVTDCSFLYTFKREFTEPLRPYFFPGPLTWRNWRGLNIHRFKHP